MKSLLIFSSKSSKVTSSDAFLSYPFVLHWLIDLFTQPIISPMFALNYTFSAFCMHTVNAITLKQLCVKDYSNAIVILCTAETGRVQTDENTGSD